MSRNRHIVVLFLILGLTQSSCEKDKNVASCEIVLQVTSTEFYEGCTIPISVLAEDGDKQAGNLSIRVNDSSLDVEKSDSDIYYWNTEGYPPGDYIINASFLSSVNVIVSHELHLSLLEVCVDCPDELTDFDGNRYKVVQIGNQCWMAENLRSTHYADGSALKNGNSPMGDSLFSPTFTTLPEALLGWYFAYNGDPVLAAQYGYLYTWFSVINGLDTLRNSEGYIQGLAPDGWHVPEVEEWQELIDFLGGIKIAGGKLKDRNSSLWNSAQVGTSRASYFSALPGGCCLFNGSYIEEGESSYFWTATPSIVNHAWHILISYHDSRVNVLGHQDSKRFGYSVRCVMN